MSERITFYPLDVTYRLRNGRAAIYLYGKAADGRRICLIDPNVNPYFYVQPKGNETELIESLRRLKPQYHNNIAEVMDIQHVNRQFNGKPLHLLKVITKLPSDVPILKDEAKKLPGVIECFEYDIPFARRYLLDTDIIPLVSITAEVELLNERSRVPVFEVKSITAGDEDVGNLKVLSVDIETYSPPGSRIIQPEKNPILMAAFYGNHDGKEFRRVITWKRFPTAKDYIEFVSGEQELVERIRDVINQYQPDILTGYFSDGFDLPYIEERARKYHIPLDLGLDYSQIDIDKRSTAVQITGIVHLDVFKFVKRVLARSLETDSLSLEAVSTELLGQHKHDVDLDALSDIWDNRPEHLEKYCEYNIHDAYITFLLCQKILPNVEELVKIIGLPMVVVSRMSFSKLVENYIQKQCRTHNELVPNRPDYRDIGRRRMHTYQGAFVLQPKPGLYENVVVFDFRSLYPSIITSHNISPGTINCECCHETIPGEKYWFCKKKKGFLPSVLENIITRRMRIKEIVKKSTEKNTLLEARNEALKVLANAFYGYLGFAPARWYSLESAQGITALGRHYIQGVIDKAQKSGFAVLYSDTDSIFLQLKDKSKQDAQQFVDSINAELPGLMELEYEGFYPAALFVSAKAGEYGAKKKYALLTERNQLKIRGFETVRRNWSPIAKEAQEKVLNIVLREKDTAKALKYVQDIISGLRERTIPIAKVIMSTQLQKPVQAYENVGPHVTVAKRMAERGIDISPGTAIRFVVTAGKGIIRDRAKIPDEVQNNEYDAEYYINNQVLPAVERIFDVLGIKIEDLTLEHRQSTLGKFFG